MSKASGAAYLLFFFVNVLLFIKKIIMEVFVLCVLYPLVIF